MTVDTQKDLVVKENTSKLRSNVEVVRVGPAADKLESQQHVIVAGKANCKKK